MISKRITSVFEMRESGEQAARALLQHQIAPERLLMLAGAAVATKENENEVGAGEAAGTLLGAGLTGLITLVIPGIGILLGAATAIATLGLAGAADETAEAERPVELE